MYTISKEFHFSASHILHGLADGHMCGRMHGHNYLLKVELIAINTDKHGFVKDYRELDPIKQWIDDHLDHRHLNDVFGDIQPSAENMAKWLFYKFQIMVPEISAIELSETPKTNCRYYE